MLAFLAWHAANQPFEVWGESIEREIWMKERISCCIFAAQYKLRKYIEDEIFCSRMLFFQSIITIYTPGQGKNLTVTIFRTDFHRFIFLYFLASWFRKTDLPEITSPEVLFFACWTFSPSWCSHLIEKKTTFEIHISMPPCDTRNSHQSVLAN